MSQISAVTTWASAQILTAAALNGEFTNVYNTWNNHDNASSAWTNLKVSGTSTMQAALSMSSNKITSLTNGSATSDAAAYGQIKVNQAVVVATSTTSTATTSSTFTACTNMSATITPSTATSNILIFITGTVSTAAVNKPVILTIKRGSTNIGDASFGVTLIDSTVLSGTIPCSIVYTDAPGAASAQTYQLFIRNNDNSTSVTWNTDAVKATMFLMEVLV